MCLQAGAPGSAQVAVRAFLATCKGLEQAGIQVPYKVVASSKVLRFAGKSMALNAVDPGAALFSALDPHDSPDLYQPFHALTSRLIQIRTVTRSEFLEEAPFAIAPGMRIGLTPIGYSDGMHRLHCGEVLVHGIRVPIPRLRPPSEYAGRPDPRPRSVGWRRGRDHRGASRPANNPGGSCEEAGRFTRFRSGPRNKTHDPAGLSRRRSASIYERRPFDRGTGKLRKLRRSDAHFPW